MFSETAISEFIHLFHVALTALGIVIPLFNDEKLLKMYSLAIPFLFLHWSMNDDTCALTVIEQIFKKESQGCRIGHCQA